MSRSAFVSGNGPLSTSVSASIVSDNRRCPPSAYRPAVTVSLQTPARTQTIEPAPLGARRLPALTVAPPSSAAETEMVDAHAPLQLCTGQHDRTVHHGTLGQLPSNAMSRRHPPRDLEHAGAIALRRTGPDVVVS